MEVLPVDIPVSIPSSIPIPNIPGVPDDLGDLSLPGDLGDLKLPDLGRLPDSDLDNILEQVIAAVEAEIAEEFSEEIAEYTKQCVKERLKKFQIPREAEIRACVMEKLAKDVTTVGGMTRAGKATFSAIMKKLLQFPV